MEKTFVQSVEEPIHAWRVFIFELSDAIGVTSLLKAMEESRFVRVMFIVICIFVLAVCVFSEAHAGQETRYYNYRGQYKGRATTNSANPSQQSVYSNKGGYLGRVMTKPDGSVKYYDQHGRFTGSGLPSSPAQPKK